MLALSNPADKAIRAQVAEAVSLIAELDFPDRWTDLIDVSAKVAYTSFSNSPSATGGISFTNRL
jgi:hypothetical protein